MGDFWLGTVWVRTLYGPPMTTGLAGSPRAALLLKVSVPWLTVTGPVKVLAPRRSRTPTPPLVRPPEPAIVPRMMPLLPAADEAAWNTASAAPKSQLTVAGTSTAAV